MAGTIKLKRAYEAPNSADGVRILVDRLWPRGVSKDEAALDEWNKELAPSNELRHWFGHDPARWTEFGQRYAAELADKTEQLKALRALARKSTVTFVYGAHDETHNQAVVLRNVVLGKAPTAAMRSSAKTRKPSK
jgi:uncharacterized protein YeaO (DUF488 family)